MSGKCLRCQNDPCKCKDLRIAELEHNLRSLETELAEAKRDVRHAKEELAALDRAYDDLQAEKGREIGESERKDKADLAAKDKEIAVMRERLRTIIAVLGPTPPHCGGCAVEIGIALSEARQALGGKP